MKQVVFGVFIILSSLQGIENAEAIHESKDDEIDSKKTREMLREIYESLYYPHFCVLYGDCREYKPQEEGLDTPPQTHPAKEGDTFDSPSLDNSASGDSESSPSLAEIDYQKYSPSLAEGEQSGIILGFGVGYHNARFTQNYEQVVTEIKAVAGATGADAREMITTTTQLEPPINAIGYGIGNGLILGYQGFFAPFDKVVQLGMRVYGDLNATLVHFTSNGVSYAPTALRYGFNIDFMTNFIVVERVLWLGLFAGVRIGGTSYLGDDIKAIDRRLRALGNGGAFPKGSFDFAVNVGLRTNIAKNNGFELIFAIPMYQAHYKASDESVVNDKTTAMRLSGAFKERWSVGLRYIWTFSVK